MSNTTDPLVRGEPNVDVDWGTGSPASSIGVDTFEANFEGQIQIDTAGSYTFYGTSDDGIRVFVDGNLVVDAWVDRGPTETAGTPIDLTAGKHEIRVAYYENGGGAMVRLGYESADAGVAKQTVPITKLTPTTGTDRAGTDPGQRRPGRRHQHRRQLDRHQRRRDRLPGPAPATGADTGFATVATLPADQSVYIDTGATDPSTTYYYRIVATAGRATATSDPDGRDQPRRRRQPRGDLRQLRRPQHPVGDHHQRQRLVLRRRHQPRHDRAAAPDQRRQRPARQRLPEHPVRHQQGLQRVV